MFKKILTAIAVIVVPLGTALAAGVAAPAVASAAAPPPATVTCGVTGTVTFDKPGLSAGGALTSNSSVTTKTVVTPTGTGCSGTPISVSIPSTTTPCAQTAGVPDSGDPAACLASTTKQGVTTYAIAKKPNSYDTSADFAINGVSNLQAALLAKPLKTTINGAIKVVLAYGTADQVLPGGVCDAYTGFYLTGNAEIKGVPVGTYTDTVCLTNDSGTGTTGDFLTDLLSPNAVIATATVGGNSSMVVTLNPS